MATKFSGRYLKASNHAAGLTDRATAATEANDHDAAAEAHSHAADAHDAAAKHADNPSLANWHEMLAGMHREQAADHKQHRRPSARAAARMALTRVRFEMGVRAMLMSATTDEPMTDAERSYRAYALLTVADKKPTAKNHAAAAEAFHKAWSALSPQQKATGTSGALLGDKLHSQIRKTAEAAHKSGKEADHKLAIQTWGLHPDPEAATYQQGRHAEAIKAGRVSAKADKATVAAKTGGLTSPDLHHQAASLHAMAAEAHKALGNEANAAHHNTMAGLHRDAARGAVDAGGGRVLARTALLRVARSNTREMLMSAADRARIALDWQRFPMGMKWVDKVPGLPEDTLKEHGHKPERQAMHEDIKHKFTAHVPSQPENHRSAILTMGGPASGKGTVLRKAKIDKSKYVNGDPDEVKEHIPEYKVATKAKAINAGTLAHEESSHVVKKIIDHAIEHNKNVIIDGTGVNHEKYNKNVAKLKAQGYHTKLILVDNDMNTALPRAILRAGHSGRLPPKPYMDEVYNRIPASFLKVKDNVDEFHVYDNRMGKQGGGAKLVWSKKDGVETIHDPKWHADFHARAGQSHTHEWDRLTRPSELVTLSVEDGMTTRKAPPGESLDEIMAGVVPEWMEEDHKEHSAHEGDEMPEKPGVEPVHEMEEVMTPFGSRSLDQRREDARVALAKATDKSKAAKAASNRAHDSSAKTDGGGSWDDHDLARIDHERAAEAHKLAAKSAANRGDMKLADHHKIMAGHHTAMAIHHEVARNNVPADKRSEARVALGKVVAPHHELTARAHEASAKAEKSGIAADHLAAQLAHESAAQAHRRAGDPDEMADEHAAAAEYHHDEHQHLRGRHDKRSEARVALAKVNKRTGMPKGYDPNLVDKTRETANAATLAANRPGGNTPELHRDAARKHWAAADAYRAVGNHELALHHEKMGHKHSAAAGGMGDDDLVTMPGKYTFSKNSEARVALGKATGPKLSVTKYRSSVYPMTEVSGPPHLVHEFAKRMGPDKNESEHIGDRIHFPDEKQAGKGHWVTRSGFSPERHAKAKEIAKQVSDNAGSLPSLPQLAEHYTKKAWDATRDLQAGKGDHYEAKALHDMAKKMHSMLGNDDKAKEHYMAWWAHNAVGNEYAPDFKQLHEGDPDHARPDWHKNKYGAEGERPKGPGVRPLGHDKRSEARVALAKATGVHPHLLRVGAGVQRQVDAKKADEHSAEAHELSEQAHKSDTYGKRDAHLDAAHAHFVAAVAHHQAGNAAKAAEHMAARDKHREIANGSYDGIS